MVTLHATLGRPPATAMTMMPVMAVMKVVAVMAVMLGFSATQTYTTDIHTRILDIHDTRELCGTRTRTRTFQSLLRMDIIISRYSSVYDP